MASLDPSVIAARTHYNELQQYLVAYHAKPLAERRLVARQKLTRLTRQQFQELSTDVYDELIRRKMDTPENEAPSLLPRDEFHAKRNQARQKLATLPTTRFEDLSSDVYFELSRRHPEFKEENDVGECPSSQNLAHGYTPSPEFNASHWPDTTSSGSQVTLILEEKGVDNAYGSHTSAQRPLEDKLTKHRANSEGACVSGTADQRGIGPLTKFFQYIARGTQRVRILGKCRLWLLKPWLSFWKGNDFAQKNSEKIYCV